ncbi:MAG: hypothetical protein IKL51_01090 [Lachnospiraceae bacterium]|nr:hypothetical protein [Lachnospiraceae bacterium]
MAIGHVELNNAMTRIQDYTTIKHNEDQKSSVQQNQFQNQFTKELNKDIRQVVKTDQSEYQNKTEYQNKKFDARDKGSNQYTGDGGKRRRQNQQKDEGKNIRTSGFDMKV